MPFSLPSDFDISQGIAIAFLFAAWFSYAAILRVISSGSLNAQLSTVRTQWLEASLSRAQKPFDAILLGNMVNSIAFFGSATLIVLAGTITLFASVRAVYDTVLALPFMSHTSFELFVSHMAVLNLTLAIAFFSFTYALRKLIYVLALVGALPEGQLDDAQKVQSDIMVRSASVVLTEALKTFNFGIRGYYYFVAALGLFISPYVCVGLTFFMTATLLYRQVATKTSSAIKDYVAAIKKYHETLE
ncbi:MAG: DUF599 domain-containing protein [Pseudomonadota bacterium]